MGDSAVDWALAFDKIAPTTIVHRRDNFRALEHSVEELKQSSVSIKTPFVPSRLIGENGHATHLEITKVKSDETELIPIDHLFVNYGFKSSIGNLKEWGVELQRHKIKVNQNKKPAFLEFMPVETAASTKERLISSLQVWGKLQQL